MELFVTVLVLTLLAFSGAVLWPKFKWIVFVIVGIPLILAAVDYFIPGDQTLFRLVVYIVYAFLLYTVAIFRR